MLCMTQAPLAEHQDFVAGDAGVSEREDLQLLLSCNDFSK